MPSSTTTQTYQIKIALEGIRPPIWRRLLVPSTITLGELHIVIQLAMGWQNYHMHQFIDRDRNFYAPRNDDDGILSMDIEDENSYSLDDFLFKEKDWIRYEYDFGDGWLHKILLEKIEPFNKAIKLPLCVKGKRACPPEDCGGPWGYDDLVQILGDPTDSEHDSMLEWVGGSFDPEAFRLAEINTRLRLRFKTGL